MDAFLNTAFDKSLHQDVQDLLAFGSEVRRCRNEVQQQALQAQLEAENRFKFLISSTRSELEVLLQNLERLVHVADYQGLREASSKFCSTRSNLSKIISVGKLRVETVSEDLPQTVHLRKQAQLFRNKLEEFEKAKYKILHPTSKQLPWQLTYCVETDPFSAGGGVVEFAGGKITDVEGMDVWEDLCSECGVSIQRALSGKGNIRYRDSECKHVVFCEYCFNIGTRLMKLRADDVTVRHADVTIAYLPSVSPHLSENHYLSVEKNHPVISRLEFFENNSSKDKLAQILRKAFQSDSYSNRRCVGKKKRNSLAFEWMTYEEVFRRAENFAAGFQQEKERNKEEERKK